MIMPETLRRPLSAKNPSEKSPIHRWSVAFQCGYFAFRQVVAGSSGDEASAMTEVDYDALLGKDYSVARQKIAAMKDLQPGWNSHRAGRIGDGARVAAARLLEVLHAMNTPAPEVGPTPDGGVQLAWSLPSKRGQLELEVTVFDNEFEYSFGYRDADGFIAEGRVKDPEDVASKLRAVMNSTVAA